MKRILLFLLCFYPAAAGAFDDADYPLIDLRARSMRGGLGVVSAQTAPQNNGGQQSSLTGAPLQPAAQPYPVQPYPMPQPQYYVAPPVRRSVAAKPAEETAKDSDDVKEYLKNNPQALPDV